MELNINWSVFHDQDRPKIEKAVKNGDIEHLAAILHEVTPEQASEIEKIQRQLRPKDFKFESTVQKEFEAWLSLNPNSLTPEIEAEWQSKIEAEKAERLKQMGGDITKAEVLNPEGTQANVIQVSQDLRDIKGLSDVSIKKLNDENIFSFDEFKVLPYEKKKQLLGPLVAAKFKDLTN